MVLKEIMVNEVASVIEETTNFVTNRLVMESLLKNGKVTLEEANFFNSLAKEVITEAAEDFIPETVSFEEATVEAAPAVEDTKAIEEAAALEAEAAKAKELEEAAAVEEAAKAKELEEAAALEAKEAEAKELEEAAAVEAEAKSLEEAAALETNEPVELTESELIVNRLIAKMV